MGSWDIAIDWILRFEGGYVNDPNDAGGETKYGISKRSYPQEDIKNLTVDQAKQIYRRDYWERIRGDELPFKLSIIMLDSAVNQGVKTSIKLLQISLNQSVDGIIGPKTMGAAIRSGDTGAWLYLLQRAKRYMQTKGVEYWGANWGERLIRLAELVFLDQERQVWP